MLTDFDELTIERAALGRVAIIGDFYDARRDSFVHGNLFKQKLPKECVNIETAASSISDFQFTNTTKEKLKVMKLEGELSLSVLTGMCKVGGSAKYLEEQKTNSKSMHCVFAQHVQTQVERVNLASEGIAKFIVESAISSETTHVVVGIQRGCNALVDLSCVMNENTSKSTLAGAIEGVVTAVGKIGSINGKISDETKDLLTNVKLRVFADIQPSANLTPITIEEGVKTIREIPVQLEKSANKLGVPITYELVAVIEVARILQRDIPSGAVFKRLNIESVEMAKNLLCEAEEQLLRIKEFAEGTHRNKTCLPKNKVQSIFKRRDDCIMKYLKTQEKVRGLLSLIRGDQCHTDKLTELFSNFPSSDVSEQTMDTYFEERNDVVCAIDFLDSLRKSNVHLIETTQDFMQLKISGSSYILFFSLNDLTDPNDEWYKTLGHFHDICEDAHRDGKCAAVVIDVLPKVVVSQKIGDGFRIVRIKNQVYESKNLVGDLERDNVPPPVPDMPVIQTQSLPNDIPKNPSVTFFEASTLSSSSLYSFDNNHWMEIFLRCDPMSLLKLSKACHLFNDILSKPDFWEKKCERDGIALPPLAWRRFVETGALGEKHTFNLKQIYFKNPYNRNLAYTLTPTTTFEQLQKQFSVKFERREQMKIECPPDVMAADTNVSACISANSSMWSRSFEIDLVKAGIEEWILDNIRPVITVKESYIVHPDSVVNYVFTAALRYNNNLNLIDPTNYYPVFHGFDTKEKGWRTISRKFDRYGRGFRKIWIKTSGHEFAIGNTQKGNFDIKFANTSVTVEFPEETRLISDPKCTIS